jgi:hypothetical protein
MEGSEGGVSKYKNWRCDRVLGMSEWIWGRGQRSEWMSEGWMNVRDKKCEGWEGWNNLNGKRIEWASESPVCRGPVDPLPCRPSLDPNLVREREIRSQARIDEICKNVSNNTAKIPRVLPYLYLSFHFISMNLPSFDVHCYHMFTNTST